MNIFHESFDTETNGLPGGWRVECNSNLAEVPAIRLGENCIELLSAGNKYLPIIPDVQDFQVKTRLSFNYACAECGGEGTFGVTLAFRYDAKYRRGQSLRLRQVSPGHFVFQYGYVRRNVFTPQQEIPFEMDDALLNQPFDLEIVAKGAQLSATAFGFTANFCIQEGRGSLAFSRMHFFDVLKILEWDVFTDDSLRALSEKSFTIPMPDELTYYPIFCDVKLQDFGNCYEADLTFSGGVKYTPYGEGNYRSLRTDLLTRPYLSVIEKDSLTRHTLFRRDIVLVPEGLPNKFFYGVLNEKVDWPFHRRVRFAKPDADFDLALGFETYVHGPNAELAQSPSETIFEVDGSVVYSGRGIIDATPKVDFLSQPEKEFARFLPKDEPRYQDALDFLKYNHFFMEGETPRFAINIIGKDVVGGNFEVTLEDALLRTVRTLSFKAHGENIKVGVRTVPAQCLEVEPLEGLQCGVWHLRLRGKDCCCDVEDYCAFEIMSRQENALPPPLLSGLPWLYNSRTETRGLVTDGFDTWKGKSVNAPHYLAAANFLPPAARKYNVIPTVHAYQRQYFLWLGTRCLDKSLLADNMDLVNQADYVYMADELNQMSLLWLRTYKTFVLEKLIEYGKSLNDAGFPLKKLQEELEKGEHIDLESFRYLALNHWSSWLDYINEVRAAQKRELLEKLRQGNPKLFYAQYGPAHIYAGCLKGPEFIRLLQNAKSTTDIDGYWQYEDYPYSCNYGLERGSYFLASALLALPGSRIYPEIYRGGGRGGCGDGAVYYGYPPFGQRPVSYPQQMAHYVFEFCYATAHRDASGLHYWEKCGFQACGFTRPWNEALLKAWRLPAEHKPASPVWNVAFVSSANSLRAAQKETQFLVEYPQYGIVDVRNTASEVVPYLAQTARKMGLPPGFQILEECLVTLSAKDVSLLVLPPLKGMAKESLDKIRQLHKEGVSLIACEDVTGLEELFGVRDTGERRNPTHLHGTAAFMPGQEEICDDERCTGRYEAVDAEVLISAEIPVLTLRRNGSASAAFFNVAPNLVREDALIERMTYGKEGISEFMAQAVALLMNMLSPAPMKADCGRIVACRTCKGELLLMAYNRSGKHGIDMEISLSPEILAKRTLQCSQPYSRIGNGRLRIKLPIFGSAVFIFS